MRKISFFVHEVEEKKSQIENLKYNFFFFIYFLENVSATGFVATYQA